MKEYPVAIDPENIYYLDVNGLKGRHIILSSKKKKKITVIGGLFSTCEKYASFLEYLRKHGEVHYVDLPGIGGMSSLYDINEHPSLENYGRYLFSVLKTLQLNSKSTIIAFDEGIYFLNDLLQNHKTSRRWFDAVIGFKLTERDITKLSKANAFRGATLRRAAKNSLGFSADKKVLGLNKSWADLSTEARHQARAVMHNSDPRTATTLINDMKKIKDPASVCSILVLGKESEGYRGANLVSTLPKNIYEWNFYDDIDWNKELPEEVLAEF